MSAENDEPLLEVEHLKKYYAWRPGLLRGRASAIRAVDDVSFQLDRSKTLGLVGESGCGKTTTGRTILRLVEPTAGRVVFRTRTALGTQTHDVFRLPPGKLRALRRHMQMIFQDPHGSLNPRLTVGATIEEGMTVHGLYGQAERRERVGQLLERVGLDRNAARHYPHAFSGGQRQRIGIARALAVEPSLLVCDEPVSALDVSVQAQILNLLKDLQSERQLTYLFIAHDLAVVAYMSHQVGVMYGGQIVEMSDSADLYRLPAHPYTRMLMAALPKDWTDLSVSAVTGRTPAEHNPAANEPQNTEAAPPGGCRFCPRCPEALPECAHVDPPLIQIGAGHQVRCHLWKDYKKEAGTTLLVPTKPAGPAG